MSDYNYAFHGCYELTLEISCCKYPPASALPELWRENKKALLELVKQAHGGVTGSVLDEETQLPLAGATLKIVGRDIEFATSNRGEFWRLLLPGTYALKVQADGYHPIVVGFEVKAYSVFPKLTSLKILLVNETKPAPTTTTVATSSTTVATTMRITTRQAIIKKRITTVDKPIHFKQVSSSDAVGNYCVLTPIIAILLTLLQC